MFTNTVLFSIPVQMSRAYNCCSHSALVIN